MTLALSRLSIPFFKSFFLTLALRHPAAGKRVGEVTNDKVRERRVRHEAQAGKKKRAKFLLHAPERIGDDRMQIAARIAHHPAPAMSEGRAINAGAKDLLLVAEVL